MTRRDATAAALAALCAVGMAYALTRITWAGLTWTPILAPFAAGLVVGFRAGQYQRGFTHARGIWKSHKAAIRGGHR